VGFNMAPYFYRSVDGGADWIQNPSVNPPPEPNLVVDGSTNPSTIFDGLAFRSTDGGVTWPALAPSAASVNTTALAVDPSGTLYAAGANGMFVSHDHGQTWTAIGSPVYSNISSIVPAGSGGTLYATIKSQQGSAGVSLGISEFSYDSGAFVSWTSGFISKLSADGSTIEYSTYLGGHPAAETWSTLISSPILFQTHNWISGIALDAAGNVVVAGSTRATDFPTVNPAQAANAGLADAFAAILSADGSTLKYSTYFGGPQDDGALAVGIDSTGDVIFAGQTFSPVPYTYGDAFVVKLETGPPAITSVLNGASFQPGIEAGSWVSIKGTNLSNTTRAWTSADFVGNSLPTSLDGVSVTIDGEPAFVSYISPSQINVQAPSDSTLGAVNVVVDNNKALSPPAPAQLQAAAPAFFTYLVNSYALASHWPDYALVGTPSSPAMPGDTLVLWGTGFGATSPPFPAGTVVSGVAASATLPVVTVGGMPVQVTAAVLTPESAGLYQLTIQLPPNVPTGAVALQASVGGVPSPAGVTIFIGP